MKKLTSVVIGLRLHWKLFLCYLFATVLPLLSACVITFTTTSESLKRQSQENIAGNLRQINSVITENLESYSQIMDIIVVNKYIQNYIALDYSQMGYEDMYYFVDGFFKSIQLTNPAIESITIYSENDTLPRDEYYFHPVEEGMEEAAWYEKVKYSKGTEVYGQYQAKADGGGSFSLARCMTWHQAAVPSAVLAIRIGDRQIRNAIDKSGGTDHYFIVDEEGKLVFPTESAFFGRNIQEIDGLNASPEDLAQQTVLLRQEPHIVTALTLGNGWRTLAVTPLGGIRQSARQSAMWILAVGAAFFAVAIVLTYVISYAFSQKTRELTDAVKRLRNGEYGVVLPQSSGGEIGELVDAFNDMSTTIERLISEVYEKELSLKQAELNMLQEQVRPHFLYNALSSISSLAMRNQDEETCRMVRLLSDFYRMSLNSGNTSLTVEQELTLTHCYVAIQKVRFQERIAVTFDVDESLLSHRTLKLLLQPIIENSISHGLYDSMSTLHIRVTVAEREGMLAYTVEDDGAGMDAQMLAALRSDLNHRREGFGLKNVNVRIKLTYGEPCGLQIDSEPMRGTRVTLTLPLEVQEK